MGSITSRPKAPPQPQPQVVFMPQAAPAPGPSPSIRQPAPEQTDPVTDKPAAGSSDEEAQVKEREKNLLKRNRGRLGTIVTGFGGLLNRAGPSPKRKTLLGE